MIKRKLLKWSDEFIYNFLRKNVNIMPIRFCKFIAAYYTDARIRKLYWEKMGVKFGEKSFANIGFNVIFNRIENIKVYIGNNVSIAKDCTLIIDSGPCNDSFLLNCDYVKSKLIHNGNSKIIIEDDVWIGANVTIMPNITIKKGSIIGACSLVTKDTEEYTIYAGTPAKKIRKIKK
ncbi:acyltransferase [Campylobacter lari]